MGKSIEGLREKFLKWKEAFETNWIKDNLKKIKVMVSGLKGKVLKNKVDPCDKCGRRVMENSVMYTKCGKWEHGRCAKMKRVSQTLANGLACKQCAETIKGIMEPDEEISCLDKNKVMKSSYWLGNRLNASGGSKPVVTAKTIIGRIEFRECGEVALWKKVFV